MKAVVIYVPETYLVMIDEAVKNGFSADRSQFVRDSIRDVLKIIGLWTGAEVSHELKRRVDESEGPYPE